MHFLPTNFEWLLLFLLLLGLELNALNGKAKNINETLTKILEQLKSRKN